VVPLVKRGDAVPLFSWGVLDAKGQVVRDPTFPDLPHFVEAYEMMHGKKPSGVEFDAYMAFFGSGFAAQKPAMLPKGTPKPIVAAYRKAFADAVADPDCRPRRARCSATTSRRSATMSRSSTKVATTIDPKARAWVRDYLTKNHKRPPLIACSTAGAAAA
jgi:hypothetical protein